MRIGSWNEKDLGIIQNRINSTNSAQNLKKVEIAQQLSWNCYITSSLSGNENFPWLQFWARSYFFFSYAILQPFKFTLKIIWEEKTTFPHFCGFMKYESSWERYITIIGVCIHIRKSGWCTASMFTRLYVHTCQIWSIWLTSWFPQKFKTPTKSSRWKTKLIVRQFDHETNIYWILWKSV